MAATARAESPFDSLAPGVGDDAEPPRTPHDAAGAPGGRWLVLTAFGLTLVPLAIATESGALLAAALALALAGVAMWAWKGDKVRR